MLYGCYLERSHSLAVATVMLVSDLEAAGGRDADLAYVLVAEDIEARIASGELGPGTRLRSERDLAEHYGRAYGTIRKAIGVLRDKGLIVTRHGRGNYVAGMPEAPAPGGASGPPG